MTTPLSHAPADYLYFGVVRGALQLFDCEADATGNRFLPVSPDIACGSAAHWAIIPYGVASICICGLRQCVLDHQVSDLLCVGTLAAL